MAENVKIGIQMYTLREFGDKDLPGTLEGVKRLGYDAVEFAGYNGLAADELKRICNELGLAIVSTHYSLDNFENSIEDAVAYHKALGLPFLAIPWMAADRGPGGEKYEETKKLVEASAAALKEAGIQMLYHNHDFEFTALEDGTLAIDRLYQDIPDLLPEFDTCWVKYAGYDPVKYINAYKGRTPVIHLKDFVGHKDTKPAYALIDKDGNCVSDMMGAYVLFLYFDLVPEQFRDKFAWKLVQSIEANGGCLDTGFLATPYLLDTTAYQWGLQTGTEYPRRQSSGSCTPAHCLVRFP